MKRDIIKILEEHSVKYYKQYSEKYLEDVGLLYNSYINELIKQENWSEEFLKGYLSCISDLIIIKKGYWGSSL